jgi:hypothetical protein
LEPEVADDNHNFKHFAAFLGAPVGTYALAGAIWFGLKEACSSVGSVAVECVRSGGAEYYPGGIITFATIVAIGLAIVIEVAMD